MEQEKGLVTREEMDIRVEEETWDRVMAVLPTVMILMLLLLFIQQATVTIQETTAMAVSPRVPVLAQALDPIAANVGAMWFQMTPTSRSNELRMIAENSTGAFESMLLGLST